MITWQLYKSYVIPTLYQYLRYSDIKLSFISNINYLFYSSYKTIAYSIIL